MSPRAAWRLTQLGFTEVYDFVGSKMEWIGTGLPYEGSLAEQVTLATLADPKVPLCSPSDSLDEVRQRIGPWSLCLVVNDERIVLGLVSAESLAGSAQPLLALMQEGPTTYRPHITAAEIAPRLDQHPVPYLIVTGLDGRLIGVVNPGAVKLAARGRPS